MLNRIDAIIFDLGNVLIDLDYPKVINEFSKISHQNTQKIRELVVTDPILQDFEIGKIDAHAFRKKINFSLGSSVNDKVFDKIWNSMLKQISKERMNMLTQFRKKFKVYILSNTNIIHQSAFERLLFNSTGKSSFEHFADKVYFSHEMGMRKPDQQCYEFIIKDIEKDPSSLLFLDDREDNLLGAQSCGINTLQITDPDKQIKELFNAK